jgi:phosphonate transport system substrate-binding protein
MINRNVEKVFGKGANQKVKDALLSITTKQKEITDFFQTDKFIETKNKNYDKIEKVAKDLKMVQ